MLWTYKMSKNVRYCSTNPLDVLLLSKLNKVLAILTSHPNFPLNCNILIFKNIRFSWQIGNLNIECNTNKEEEKWVKKGPTPTQKGTDPNKKGTDPNEKRDRPQRKKGPTPMKKGTDPNKSTRSNYGIFQRYYKK